MGDAADKVVEDEARAMELLEQQERARIEREARIAASMRVPDPNAPRYCRDCKEQIDPARLKIYMYAPRCTACSAAYEKDMRARYPW